ncbi:hypothetical protein Aperf_G00000065592 [Anoplocephala perfoliata]
MQLAIVLVMIDVSLLVCSASAHEDTNGPYQPSTFRQSASFQQQEKLNSKDIQNALVNMDPETFKSIILGIPNLTDFLLQFDHHHLMAAFRDALAISHLSPQEFKEVVRYHGNIKRALSGIDGSEFKTILLHFCLNKFKSFISYLDKTTIQSIMCTMRQQSDGPMHPQNYRGQPSPSPHCPSNPRESYQRLPPHLPSSAHSNPSHFDKATNQEVSSSMAQIRHEKDSTFHSSHVDRLSPSLLLIFCTFSQLFYAPSLYLL